MPPIYHDFSRVPVHTLAAATIQTKLSINTPGDEFEQEADRVADRVMRAPGPQGGRRQISDGACIKCQMRESAASEGRVQTKREAPGDMGHAEAPAIVHEALQSPSQPLDPGTRAFFEPRFGHDFAAVRVHAGMTAAQSARDINARAYTSGPSIVFAEGQYSTSTLEGKHLLAHELTHVLQQGATSHSVVRRAPWGTCPEGPRRSASNPFIYGAAELFAVAQYKARNLGHCLLTNEMLAAGIVPTCGGEEKVMVDAIMRQFHHEHEVRRRAVASPRDVTRRPEGKAGALIQSGLETVKALQQPDIIDVSTREVYDITTVGQRQVKSNKFKSRYLPVLNAITHRSWSAGTRLKALIPLTFKVPKLGTICFGPTDLVRWPGVLQYEVIKPDDGKKKGKETKKKQKESKKESEKDEKKQEKKGAAPGGNVGFGIGIFSSGGGKGNAVLGVAINAHGQAYGTVSAGIIYDANGNAVGAASVGAGAHVSGNLAGGATAGAAARTSSDAALAASAGTAKDADATALASASSGSTERSSTVTIATAGQGEAKDIEGTAIAKKGSGSGSESDGSKSGDEKDVGHGATAGLQIPGKSEAEVKQAVADAARIDAAMQHASQAQKELMAYLAQQMDDLQYEVPDANWVYTFMQATVGLNVAEIKFLQTQSWEPGNVTAEELRKQIDERLQNRNRSQRSRSSGTQKKDPSPVKEGTAEVSKGDRKGTSDEVKKPDDGIKAANLDEAADPKHAENDKEAYRRLFDRAQKYNWKQLATVGVIVYGKEGKVYAPKTVSGALYISTMLNGKRVRLTADVAGILTKEKGGDVLEVHASSIVVTTDNRAGPGSMLVGQRLTFQH